MTCVDSRTPPRWRLEALSPNTMIRAVEQKNPFNTGSRCIRKADMILLAVLLCIWPQE
jgi:hypothetical protein